MLQCPECKTEASDRATVCLKCGYEKNLKIPLIAALLSSLWPGLGHIYLGKARDGIFMGLKFLMLPFLLAIPILGLAFLLAILPNSSLKLLVSAIYIFFVPLFLLVILIFWILGMYRAYRCAEEINRDEARKWLPTKGGASVLQVPSNPNPEPKQTCIVSEIQKPTVSENKTLIAGKYELLRQIGQGGMGLVYEAKDHSLGRRVAIKKMRPEVAMNPKEKARFLDEAKIVAQLRHPSIVDIHEIIEESNEVYLVFEYVEGQNLAEMIAKHGKLAAAEMGSVLGGVCRALAFAHSKKVIHRDLKPSNIMVTKAEGAKVMDFGIAGQALDAMSRVSRVETAGTFAYMSPEQHLGKWDARSDIYSLGATIYEALTGDIPFRGPDFLAQKERSVFKPLTEILPDCNVRLNEIIVRCLKPDPKERFQTIEEFARAAGV